MSTGGAQGERETRGFFPADAPACGLIEDYWERMGSPGKLAACVHFFWAGLVNCRQTGAFLPSQSRLIDRMIAPIPPGYSGRIIELGAGTGALTVRLAARCPKARILACDLNPVMVNLAGRLLRNGGAEGRVKVVRSSAAQVLAEVSEPGAERPHYVVSGIPLGNLAKDEVRKLVDSIWGVLKRDGMFIQFQYSLLSRKIIRSRFPRVRTVPVFLNLPPAVVYLAPR
jgi:phospholipid N-methyltransferase